MVHWLASLRHLALRQHPIEDLAARRRVLLQGQPLRCLEFAPSRRLYRGIRGEDLPALHPGCVDSGALTLDYAEHLRVNRVTPDPDTSNGQSLNIACETDAAGRRRWLGQPGNWVLRERGAGRPCRLVGTEWRR